jgi:hypothetical protein
MNEDELRALIRQAVQKHLHSGSAEAPQVEPERRQTAPEVSISFGQYRLERAPDDNMCLIEPAVRCNHCGFCKCHGH